jgi:hypothetical protein
MVLPILLLLIIGAVDLLSFILTYRSVEFAAFRGARELTLPGTSEEEVEASVRSQLKKRGLSRVSDLNLEMLKSSDRTQVNISTTHKSAGIIPPLLLNLGEIRVEHLTVTEEQPTSSAAQELSTLPYPQSPGFNRSTR